MRGRRADAASLLEAGSAASDSEDSHSQPHSRAGSPLSEFAAKYIGNANKDLNKSIFKNVAGWMKRDEERTLDNLSTTSSKETANNKPLIGAKKQSQKTNQTNSKEDLTLLHLSPTQISHAGFELLCKPILKFII